MANEFILFGLFIAANANNKKQLVPGAGLEPARPQWPGDFKCLPPYFRYIPVHLATTQTLITKPIFL